jgi:hypothetical protein
VPVDLLAPLTHGGRPPAARLAKKVSTALSQEHEVGVKMVWGGRRRHGTFGAVEQSDGVPHAAIERSEPVPHRSVGLRAMEMPGRIRLARPKPAGKPAADSIVRFVPLGSLAAGTRFAHAQAMRP